MEVLARCGIVNQNGELVASLAFVDVGLEEEVVVLIVDVKRWLHVVLCQLDGKGAFSIDCVLEVAATLDFPTVVYVGATDHETSGQPDEKTCYGECSAIAGGLAGSFGGLRKHIPKLEIIFDVDVL